MPRYVVERTFTDGLLSPAESVGAARCLAVVERNTDEGVTWLYSYRSEDREKTFCIYDAPSPGAISSEARRRR